MGKRLELKLPAAVVAPLIEYLLPLAGAEDAAPLAIAPDLKAVEEDFREQWSDDLALHLAGDLGRFVAVFNTDNFPRDGTAEFGPDDCEPLLRACSALRLKLRDRRLGAIADSVLETGDIDHARLNQDEQLALAAYMFLAALQEIIIRHLDPDSDFEEDDDEVEEQDEEAGEGEE